MPLEPSFDYIDDLNPLWPLFSDDVEEGDDHIRGTKGALQGNVIGDAIATHILGNAKTVTLSVGDRFALLTGFKHTVQGISGNTPRNELSNVDHGASFDLTSTGVGRLASRLGDLSSAQSLLEFERDQGVRLMWPGPVNAGRVLFAEQDGVGVSNNNPGSNVRLRFYKWDGVSAYVEYGNLRFTNGLNMNLDNLQAGGMFQVRATNSAVNTSVFIAVNPDGVLSLSHGDPVAGSVTKLRTDDQGIFASGQADDYSLVAVADLAGTARGFFGHIGSDVMRMRNNVQGGNVNLEGNRTGGGTAVGLELDPDGILGIRHPATGGLIAFSDVTGLRSFVAAPTNVADLTRKDYVDGRTEATSFIDGGRCEVGGETTDGVLIQGGLITSTASSGTVVFPQPFGNRPVVIIGQANGVATTEQNQQVRSVSAGGFSWDDQGGANQKAWIAIGQRPA